MNKVTITEIARNLADYINRVVYRGERFTLIRGKKPVAELGPVPIGMKLNDLEAILKSLPKLSPQELEEFSNDLHSIRQLGNEDKLRDRWE